ncbi:hypothetical protein [Escherichia coli]|nr:hypothetical protein [Escherichia coli]
MIEENARNGQFFTLEDEEKLKKLLLSSSEKNSTSKAKVRF